MTNTITDLNDLLFSQLDRLANATAADLDAEVARAEAIVKVADTVIDNARIGIQAASIVANHGDRFRRDLPMLTPPEPVGVK